jgi:Transport and Golgi organisation 2
MCTLVLLRRPGSDWPLLLAANRDELRTRPWRAPARHWPDRPEVVAGLDVEAGGSWLGMNDEGVVAAVLNRVGTLGPAPGKRSRGELVLDALDHAEAGTAAAALSDLDPEAYRPFNLIVADRYEAYWLRHAGTLPDFGFRASDGTWREVDPILLPNRSPGARSERRVAAIECHPIGDGLSMITARDLNDFGSARVRTFLPRLRAAETPDPARGNWSAWEALLADRQSPDDDPRNAMTIVTETDYGTVCSSLVALPAEGGARMWFAAGRPGETRFEPVEA